MTPDTQLHSAYKMLRLAVFGDPVAHSLSPIIHQQFARHSGLLVDYQAIHASSDELNAAMATFRAAGGQGANLTTPHKQAGLSVCATLSDRAQVAGAVNTLLHTATGWRGDNTDGLGLLWDLQRLQVTLTDSHILIIGAGGAARGIMPALLAQQPASLTLANRTISRAQQLAKRFAPLTITACGLTDVATLQPIDLIIHASAGGHQNTIFSLPILATQANVFCYDLNYGQAARPFLDWAGTKHYLSSDGLGMLVAQAAESFGLWTGHTVSSTARKKTLAYLRAR